MKRKTRAALVAFLLVITLLLQGCVPLLVPYPVYLTPSTQSGSEPTRGSISPSGVTQNSGSTEPSEPGDPDRHYRGELVFSDIPYRRPDADAIRKGFEKAQELVGQGASPELIISVYDEAYQGYLNFDTMSNLAYIRYTLNLSDEFYYAEYLWLKQQDPLIRNARSACESKMAASLMSAQLERDYFGEGYFDTLGGAAGSLFSNSDVVALMQQESELQAQYMALQNAPTITWRGEECSFDELLSTATSSDLYTRIYQLYYEKYNPLAAELFIKLIRVRKEIAAKAGYDSYATLAYDYYYGRDYTPEQARQYTAAIAKYLSPKYRLIRRANFSRWCSSQEVLEKLALLADSLGGDVKAAYDYMMQHKLYDLTASVNKMSGSYMTYLNGYEMPFVYVSPTGDIDDVLTTAHEFGHFVDGYVNYNTTGRIDCNEIFSQSMEYLALSRIGLSESDAAQLSKSKLADSLSIFLGQACYAEFEDLAYRLPDDELTPTRLNQLYEECCKRFKLSTSGLSSEGEPSWIDVNHFFIAPYYVISYCISGDAALQLYRSELSDGSGFALFEKLLTLAPGRGVLELLEEAGMDSPFVEGRIAELADFYQDRLTR